MIISGCASSRSSESKLALIQNKQRCIRNSGVTDRDREENRLLGKLNVNTVLPHSLYFGFFVFSVFSRLLFSAFFRVLRVSYGFGIAIQVNSALILMSLFWVLTGVPHSVKFQPIWLKHLWRDWAHNFQLLWWHSVMMVETEPLFVD